MARKAKEKATKVSIMGFSRVQLKEGKKLVGDSGWVQNQIQDGGCQQFIMNLIGKTTGSLQVGAMAVGTGGMPASNENVTLAGEYGSAGSSTNRRIGVGTGGWAVATTQRTATNATATLQFSGSWGSGSNAGASNISNIGLFDVSTTSGSMFAANTYTSSSWSTNQDLYASYQIRISFS
jgi:hypothetical protein